MLNVAVDTYLISHTHRVKCLIIFAIIPYHGNEFLLFRRVCLALSPDRTGYLLIAHDKRPRPAIDANFLRKCIRGNAISHLFRLILKCVILLEYKFLNPVMDSYPCLLPLQPRGMIHHGKPNRCIRLFLL